MIECLHKCFGDGIRNTIRFSFLKELLRFCIGLMCPIDIEMKNLCVQ